MQRTTSTFTLTWTRLGASLVEAEGRRNQTEYRELECRDCSRALLGTGVIEATNTDRALRVIDWTRAGQYRCGARRVFNQLEHDSVVAVSAVVTTSSALRSSALRSVSDGH